MTFAGFTADVPVSSLDLAREFYRQILGRAEDLSPTPGMLEWILHDSPQVAVRIVEDHAVAGSARVGIGVSDLEAERARLAATLSDVPEVDVVPGVIALLEIPDADGNRVVFWQDLLAT